MIVRSTNIAAALRDRRSHLAPRRAQRGFFSLPGGLGAARPAGGGGGGGGASTTAWSTTDLSPGGGVWTLSNSNSRAVEATSADAFIRADAGKSTGLWYWELHVDVDSGASFNMVAGIREASESISTGFTSGNTIVWRSNSSMFVGSSGATAFNSPPPGTYAANTRLKFALRFDAGVGRLYIGKAGVGWENSTNPTSTATSNFGGIPAGTWVPFVATDNNGTNHRVDFVNNTTVSYIDTLPAGFSAL